jgi:flagellar assembly protein FliH
MTSWTEGAVTAADPFPLLVELPPAAAGAVDALSEVRAHAFEQAYHAGFAEGLRDGRVRGEAEGAVVVRAHVDAVLATLSDSVARQRAEEDQLTSSLGPSVIDAALRIAEAVLGRELELADSPGRDALVRALRAAPERGHLVARLHPDDAALLHDADVPGSTGRRTLEVVADPSVERGGCLLETPTGSVDALLSTAFERVREVLTGDAETDAEVDVASGDVAA